MAVAYADNTITVTGYTEGTPCTWADVHDADVGGAWGVVTEHVEDGMYECAANLTIGDASTATWFASEGEMVYFTDEKAIVVTNNATLRLGKLSGDWGIWGSYWSFRYSTNYDFSLAGSAVQLYASALISRVSTERRNRFFGTVDARNTHLVGLPTGGGDAGIVWATRSATNSWRRIYMPEMNYLVMWPPPGTFDKVEMHHAFREAIYAQFTDGEVTEPSATNPTGQQYRTYNCALSILDPVEAVTSVTLNDTSSITEKYTCNIHIADKDGAALASVDVDCEYAHLVEGSDSKSYKCIQDHTAVDATHKPITGSDWSDFWELYDAAGGAGGDWDTSFAYKAGTAEFSTAATDANGDITEQKVQYKKWVDAGAVLEVRLHKFTFTFPSGTEVVFDNITMDGAINWHLEEPEPITLTEPTITATSTVSGQVDVVVDGDAGVTNRLFYRQADDTAWTTGLTRSGDGTISQTGLTAGDIYTFVVVSDDSGYYSKPSKPLSLAVFGSVDHVYNILAVIEAEERGEYVEILCVEDK